MNAERSASRDNPAARASEGPFRAIAEYTYDWESWIDPEGKLRWVNPAVERITGYTVRECMELPGYPLPLVHEADRPAIEDVLEQARLGDEGNHYEFRVRRKDGELRWAAISFQPVQSAEGEPLGYRSSVRDIHERKGMEARLRAAVQRAEEANRAKTRFLATVSHELRTPLQAVLGYAELLATAELAPPLSKYAEAVLEQGKHLQRLVGDLLDFSSLQAGALPVRTEPYSPRDPLLFAIQAVTPQARAKGLELDTHLDLPKQLLGDPHRIAQVVTNLLGNAVKFTPSGKVQLSARFDTSSNELTVVVDDSGPGLPADGELFEPFVQGEARDGTATGVGLGLAISRHLCRVLGGTLEAGRSHLGGARLTARFPNHQSPAAAGSSEAEAPRSSVDRFETSHTVAAPRRDFAKQWPASILVIDDVAPAREFLRDALSFLGYSPSVAASADEGFRYAERLRPNVVLVDIQMPELDGWSAARGLRARLGESPYLVAMTADSQADDAQRLREVGFNAFAQKPLGMRELQALLVTAHQRQPDAMLEAKSEAGKDRAGTVALFDSRRWQELAEMEVAEGVSLLARMQTRVAGALPDALEQTQRAADAGEPEQLRRSVHDLHGLLALIGAQHSAELADRVECRLNEGGRVGEEQLRPLLSEARAVLAALREALRKP